MGVSYLNRWECDELPHEALHGLDCCYEDEKLVTRGDPARPPDIAEDQLSMFTDIDPVCGYFFSGYLYHESVEAELEAWQEREKREAQEDSYRDVYIFMSEDSMRRLLSPNDVDDRWGDDDSPTRCGIHRINLRPSF